MPIQHRVGQKSISQNLIKHVIITDENGYAIELHNTFSIKKWVKGKKMVKFSRSTSSGIIVYHTNQHEMGCVLNWLPLYLKGCGYAISKAEYFKGGLILNFFHC